MRWLEILAPALALLVLASLLIARVSQEVSLGLREMSRLTSIIAARRRCLVGSLDARRVLIADPLAAPSPRGLFELRILPNGTLLRVEVPRHAHP